MKAGLYLSLLLIIIAVEGLKAQDRQSVVDSILDKRGEVYVSTPILKYKSSGINFNPSRIDRYRGDSIYFYLGIEDRDMIIAAGDLLKILNAPSELLSLKMSDSPDEVLRGEAYPDYSTYLLIMENFMNSFPEICIIDTIGYSEKGRLILAARLGEQTSEPGEKPIAFYSSSMHGDELCGFSLMLRLINKLLNDSGTVDDLLSELQIIINPLANPDGTYFNSDTTVFGATRYNANHVDLNRNFPDPRNGNHPDGNSWQKETLSMMIYMEKYKPVISANFHGGAEVVNYPFDTWADLHADDRWFQMISAEYAEAAQSRKTNYMNDFQNGITNGHQWYEIDGGRQDYVTYFLHGRELTIELSDVKLPQESQLDDFWKANELSLMNLLRQADYGIQGIILDSVSETPVKAEVRLLNHDALNSEVYSNENGRFFRPVKAGEYDIHFSANGYKSLTLTDQYVNDYSKLFLEVFLAKENTKGSNTFITPNPYYEEFSIYIYSDLDKEIDIELFNLQSQPVFKEKRILTAGHNTITVKPGLTTPGLYILSISSNSTSEQFKIIRIQ